MSPLIEYFLDFISYDTQSSEKTGTHPSTPGQIVLADHAADELRKIGLQNVRRTPEGYVFAELPASAGCEKAPALGWIAHLDTSDAASGKDIKPQFIEFDGTAITLKNGRILHPEARLKGQSLIVTDGTTLLGADDKAGMAEIFTAIGQIIQQNIPHGKLCIGFTPDEEIGEGPLFFDVPSFGAKYAYTMDGGEIGCIEYSNFNAAMATVTFTGVSAHPGGAKGKMINAIRLAGEFDAILPEAERPEHTCGYEGFFHPHEIQGTVSRTVAHYLIRDHHTEKFDQRKRTMISNAEKMNSEYGYEAVKVEIRDQYRNMEEIIAQYPFMIKIAEEAIRTIGLEPRIIPIRGGTDGATLSRNGLPCPNLGTGGYNYHGELEYASVKEMEDAVQMIIQIVNRFAERS